MNNYRTTFTSSTNITLSTGIYDVLYRDALHYGYVKNEKPNMSGFLNHLIPSLSEYQDDLHARLLKYNKGDLEITRRVEQNIHNVYLASFNFADDAKITVPFRISKEFYEKFLSIHDVKLKHYNTDFITYIRNLLVEYVTKPLPQREFLYAYPHMEQIKRFIKKGNICHFHTTSGKVSCVPVAIEASPTSRRNIIAGFSIDKRDTVFIYLSEMQQLHGEENTLSVSDEECEKLNKELERYCNKEPIACSD